MSGPTSRARNSRQGFSLVELLVTLLILTVVLLGLAALQLQVVRGVKVSRRSDQATRLGQGVLERYLLMPAARLRPSVPGPGWFAPTRRDGTSPMDNVGPDGESSGPFKVRCMIEQVREPSTGAVNGMLITVKVEWVETATGQGALPTSVVLTTRRAL